MTLSADELEATFTYLLGKGLGVFESTNLPELSRDEVYELWLIDDTGSEPAGLFTPGDDGSSTALVESVRVGLILGLTVEPVGGSPQPTGPSCCLR